MLVVRSVSKRYGATRALEDVSVSFMPGEVHALMGENGAGKSTLGKVIAGLVRQDAGEVEIAGYRLRPGSIDEAHRAGVRLVHQELAQCPNLTVAENLCLHDVPGRGGLIHGRAMLERSRRLLRDLEPGIDVRSRLGALSPGHRQVVQIAASLDARADGSAAARVIVLDEPTSSLSQAEVDRLMRIVRDLARAGVTVIYVTHRMAEVFACCDRATVLRDGRVVGTSPVRDLDEATLVERMIGRRLELPRDRRTDSPPAHGATPALVVRRLSSPGRLMDVSLEVRAGEIVGLGGLVGAGRSELLDAIFGLDPRARGELRISGTKVRLGRPRAGIMAGLGYVPEDRKLQGLCFELSIGENVVLPWAESMSVLGVRSGGAEGRLVRERVREFRIKASSTKAQPGTLSGGNQQKVLLSRWMRREAKVLLLDEPTRGIDVGTKAEVHGLIREAASRGAAVVLVSSEMPELLALSDRVLVMRAGRIAGELRGDDRTQAEILRLATGEEARGASPGDIESKSAEPS